MVRRIIATVALVASAGLYVHAAPERANFILVNGERKSGPVVFHGGQDENLINGHLNLGVDNGKDMTFPIDQVAVIDFVGGRPDQNELAQLGDGPLLVLRDGNAQQGRFINMLRGDTLVWENQSGQRQQYALRDVSRVYLNPQSARTVFNARGGNRQTYGTTGQAAGTPGTPGTTVRVRANQAWTDTGMTVKQGDQIRFQASGQVNYGPNPDQTATPDGGPERRPNNPDPTVPVGALLGKIGNSAPFAIGTQTQALVMPASGRLMLGVNDNDLTDNSGFFTVAIAKQ
jgi:hypothetical protein